MKKVYRLISAQEWERLTLHYTQTLKSWNKEYSIYPFELELSLPSENYLLDSSLTIQSDNKDIALMNEGYLSILNRSLFSQDKGCFDEISTEIFMRLIQDLFQQKHCIFAGPPKDINYWIYTGSPAISITVHNLHGQISLLAHPRLIIKSLNPIQKEQRHLCSIEEALANQKLPLDIELSSIKLPLSAIMSLQKNDVIRSEHTLKEPMLCTYKKQALMEGQLGSQSTFKSIQITRLL